MVWKALNSEQSLSESVSKVGIELLGQLKTSSLATQGVQAGPDNDDIKQKDAPFHQKHSFDQSKELAERNLSILLVLFNMSFV